MNQDIFDDELAAIHRQLEANNRKSNLVRGRSLTCGTSFNGMVEVIIRGDGNNFLWVVLSPAEASELVHQLAASIACTATITPRTDVLNNRIWNTVKQEEQQNVVATKEDING